MIETVRFDQRNTAANPALSGMGDTNTGIYWPSGDNLAISSGGSEALRVDSNQDVLIGTSTASARLTVFDATLPQVVLTTSDTDATAKYGVWATKHYTNAEQPVNVISGDSDVANNIVRIGGGYSATNAATDIRFYTAANNTTTVGTQRLAINSSGQVEFSAGAVGAPTVTVTGDTNTGIYWPSADTMSFTTGGSKAIDVGSSQTVSIGGGNASVNNVVEIDQSGRRGLRVTNPNFLYTVIEGQDNNTTTGLQISGKDAAGASQAAGYWFGVFGSSPRMDFLAPGTSQGVILFGRNNGAGGMEEGLRVAAQTAQLQDGTVSLPGLSFVSDTNTGIWSPAADTFAISTGGTERMRIFSTGRVGIGTTSAVGQLVVDQNGASAAIPTLILEQRDVSEEFIEFDTTIGTGNATEAVGAKTLTTTHFVKVTLTGVGTRYIPVGTIA